MTSAAPAHRRLSAPPVAPRPEASPDRSASGAWRRPLVALAAAHMVGIALGNLLPMGLWPGLAASAAAACTMLAALFRRRPAAFSPLLLLAGLGYLALQPALCPQPPAGHIAGRIDAGRCRVVGTIAAAPRVAAGRQRFVIGVEQSSLGDDSLVDTAGRLRVTAAGDDPLLHRGDRVRFQAHIRGFRNFENPGGFDYRRHMALQGIRASAYLRAEDLVVLESAAFCPVDRLREAFAAFVDRRIEMPAAALLKALLVGDRRGIDPEIREWFIRAGVAHILAISGLHVGIVAGAAFFVFCRLFAFVPLFLRRGWTRKASALLTVGAVVGYGLLAGMSPSTQRAVVMVCAFMAALVFGRQTDPVNTLALAATAILIFDPAALFSVSFQLSFAAVFAILYGLEPDRRPSFFEGRVPALLYKPALFFYVSLLAVLGTLPLTAFYFNRISVVGLAANVVAIPLIGFLAVPIGLCCALVFPVSPAAAGVGLQAAAGALDVAVSGIGLFAELPFAAPRVVTPSLFEIGLYYLLMAAVLNLHRRKWARLLAAAALFLAAADACYWIQERLWHADLRVTSIDVGQGSASLVELPRGGVLLIDGGGFSDNRIFDVGAAVVGPLLWRKKIRTVDTVVLSHPNSDHFNGLVFILENFRVKQVWTNGEAADTAGYLRFAEAVRNSGAPAPAFDRIPRRRRLGGVDWVLLYPPTGFIERTRAGPWRDPNNNSIVLKATLGKVSFLFPGDVMAAAEQELAKNGCRRLSSTVMAAPHHGSRSSSTAAYLNCVDPEVVIVSSGWYRRRYFPHPVVRERYRNRGVDLYCTHRHGAVTVTTDGSRYWVETVLDVPAGMGEEG